MPAGTLENDPVCIDASLVLSLLLNEPGSDGIRRLLQGWLSRGISLISSSLLAPEVTSVIRNRVYFDKINKAVGNDAFNTFSLLPIKTFGGKKFYQLAWDLAVVYNFPRTYDMQYLAVAEINGCDLWTSDKRLANSLRGKTSRVKFSGDF